MDPEIVAPEDFPEFLPLCGKWGNSLLSTVKSLSELLEIGLELPKTSLTSKLEGGISVVGPTGSNLKRYPVNTVLAALHYDISYFSIHGPSNFPGLYVWSSKGKKFSVSIPPGHLLLQAGKEIEYLTGGFIEAGLHEVLLTKEAKEKAETLEGAKAWRVSSTLFSHIHPKSPLKPLGKFDTEENRKKYPETTGEEFTIKEFGEIGLIEM